MHLTLSWEQPDEALFSSAVGYYGETEDRTWKHLSPVLHEGERNVTLQSNLLG